MRRTRTLIDAIAHEGKRHRRDDSHAGLSVNIFAGNVVAITQQSLWGRVLNYVEEGGGRNANYRAIVGEAYRKEGLSAFFTPPKWFARVPLR